MALLGFFRRQESARTEVEIVTLELPRVNSPDPLLEDATEMAVDNIRTATLAALDRHLAERKETRSRITRLRLRVEEFGASLREEATSH